MMRELVLSVRDPDGAVRVHRFDQDEVELGRDPSALLRLTDPEVSGVHARIWRGPDGYRLSDTHSSHGTWLGPARVAPGAPVAVRSGDVVRIGPYTVEVFVDDAEGFTTDALDAAQAARALSSGARTPRPTPPPVAMSRPWSPLEILGATVAMTALVTGVALML